MALYDMAGTVVNLRAIGGLVSCLMYDSDNGLIHVRVEGLRSSLDYATININNGIVLKSTEVHSETWFQEVPAELESQFDKLGYKQYRRKLIMMSEISLKLATSLLSHQVRGEHIVQGLRASNLNYGVKIKEDYLGGWLITTNSGNRVGAKALLNSVIEGK